MAERSLVWFRSDLRVHDNWALAAAGAAKAAGGVVGLYIISPGDFLRHGTSPNRVAFVVDCLRELACELAKKNVPLLVRGSETPDGVAAEVARVAKQVEAEGVYAGREYEIHEVARDAAAASLLSSMRCKLQLFDDQVILQPGSVLTGAETPYTVFSPFKRQWMKVLASGGGVPAERTIGKQPLSGVQADEVPSGVKGFAPTADLSAWPAGERAALARLAEFTNGQTGALMKYKAQRDTPSVPGTSKLSAYLAAGVLSPRSALRAASEANEGRLDSGNEGAQTWISELVWREFYKHVLQAFPRVCMNRAFKPGGDKVQWLDRPEWLEAWKQGRTGYPIVDAGQRQLLTTGWMHNRLRMITAMFFTKDLLLDWRLGESHFMQNLIDGDLAANNGGWQWSAGVGTDAAPYFRIFNPTTQSEKFDATGAFIRKFVPELAGLSAKEIHDPVPLARLELGYPLQIVDHGEARERTLKAYKAARV